MRMNRRSVLQGVTLCALASSTLGKTTTLLAAELPCIALFDSRHAAPPPAQRAIDVAHDSAHYWRELRSIERAKRVVGVTSWSDFLQARGVLQERGFRVVAVRQRDGLQSWSMAPRSALRVEGLV